MRFRSKAFKKISCEPRFADARFAGNQHDLTLAALRPQPSSQQQLGFFLAPHECGQVARMQRLEPALHGTRPQRRPDLHRSWDALQLPCPEVIEFEQIAEKPSRTLGNHDRVWLSDCLQARREVWGLADDASLPSLSRFL